MPELPEVETIVRQLQPAVTGKTIRELTIYWPRTVEGDHDAFRHMTRDQVIRSISRRGKYICVHLANEHIITIHLRMTGKLVFETDEKDKPYIRAVFQFSDGSYLYFVDIRKFGRIKPWFPGHPLLPQLGPEPLDSDIIYRVLSASGSVRAIKTLLLDQTVLAGVGNIYADEALFQAGIHPAARANKVAKKRLRQLSRCLPEILKKAIAHHGTTISDYRTVTREQGENQFHLKVYGRTGLPCPHCHTAIHRITLNNRSSHFCPECQVKR